MKKIYLCGHTGSINRGCEAIIRSTVDILKSCGANDIVLLSFAKNQDVDLGVDKVVDIVSYPKKNIFEKGLSFAASSLLKKHQWGADYTQKKTFSSLDKNAVVFNVGGDTYCYQTPYISYALNDVAMKYGMPNVFWGCSVDERALSRQHMKDDLNKYSCVVVREKLSQSVLEKCLTDTSKIIKVCDPAFHLDIKETALPKNFVVGNTLGINVSPLVFRDAKDDNDIMYKNIRTLIDYVLNNTDMNVCLIPHVYDYERNLQDSMVLGNIFKGYCDTGRVGIVDRSLSCIELKYIISKCRFFIGARTHSTIAAYSTGVPCIAISYSIKSRGIAIDLFGTDEGYALPYKDIKAENEITEAFVRVLMENEEKIRQQYADSLPAYKETIIEATRQIMERFLYEK